MRRILWVTLWSLFSSGLVFGHGTMLYPTSRVYQVYLENPESPQTPAAQAAVAISGTQPFYDWNQVSRNLPLHDYTTAIPDGTLPAAGRPELAGINLARDDWRVTNVSTGEQTYTWYATAQHDPSYFLVYLTHEGYDPLQALTWADLELLHDPAPFVKEGAYYYLDVDIPQRTGRHVLYVIWQRIDPIGEGFYAACDITFDPDSPVDPPPDPEDPADPDPEPNAHVTYRVSGAPWSTGFMGEIEVANLGTEPIHHWTLEYDSSYDISSFWNAVITSTPGVNGTTQLIQGPAWLPDLLPGESIVVGFVGSGAPCKPDAYLINGLVHYTDPSAGLPICSMAPPDPPDPPPAAADIVFVAGTSWYGGFMGEIQVTNTGGSPAANWVAQFDAPFGITTAWNGRYRSTGPDPAGMYLHEVSPPVWSSSLAPGQMLLFGFVGSGSAGSISNPQFNAD